uniref:Uncharacterized protein n=1 Tax=viral metagenome TaxID=1070528 RepID=A0A6C0KIE3_9ZZZZ
MAFTRFNYDPCRTKKILQESTGPGRYLLNTPGNGCSPCFISDPQIRLERWGANLRSVPNGHPIDIDSDLMGLTRNLTNDCLNYKDHEIKTKRNNYKSCNKVFTDESRATNPAWMYRDLEQVRWEYPILDPQENTCIPFQNNLDTTLLEKDYFVPTIPCLPYQK